MAGKKDGADDLIDDSLLDDEGEGGGDAGEGEGEGGGEGGRKEAGGDDADVARPGPDDDLGEVEVELEEEQTETDVRDRQQADAGALERKDTEREGGDEEYSEKVRKRIGRETRRANDANARAEQAHAARVQAERDSLAAQKDAVETSKTAIEMQIGLVKEKLVKAKDDGKTKDEVDLQSALSKLESDLRRLDDAAGSLKQREQEIERGAKAAPNPRVQEWVRANKWFTDPRFGEAQEITRIIDRALAKAGYDKTSQEYFEELDRRIRRRIPEVVKYSDTQKRLREEPRRDPAGGGGAQSRERAKDPTGGVRRDAAPGAGGGKLPTKVRLDKADFSTMRTFGLDPNNKEHQREFALQKRQGGRKS